MTYELGSSNCLSYLAVYDSLQLIKAVLAFKGLLLGPLEQATSATRPRVVVNIVVLACGYAAVCLLRPLWSV